jgi:hypothetical protein
MMSPTGRYLAGALICLALWPATVQAYRPFDSTDADVAGEGEVELEFGPAGYLHEGTGKFFVAPALIVNLGIRGDREFVVEGKAITPIGSASNGSQTVLGDTAVSLKQIHRKGSLQEAPGPSVASECSLLLPEVNGETGTGAGCTAIVSNRWSPVTAHLNAGLFLERDHSWNRIAGLILEGPHALAVRPAVEILSEHGSNGTWTDSILAAAIWRQSDHLSFDAGVRAGRREGQDFQELRLGLTWGFTAGNE